MSTEPLIEKAAELEASQQSIDVRTAGDVLQRQRQHLGLNEREVADQLHITIHYVKALESNSYEKLPGAIFAKGYLKSYALFLGLDVEGLMSRYDEFAREQNVDSAEERRLLRARKKKEREADKRRKDQERQLKAKEKSRKKREADSKRQSDCFNRYVKAGKSVKEAKKNCY